MTSQVKLTAAIHVGHVINSAPGVLLGYPTTTTTTPSNVNHETLYDHIRKIPESELEERLRVRNHPVITLDSDEEIVEEVVIEDPTA